MTDTPNNNEDGNKPSSEKNVISMVEAIKDRALDTQEDVKNKNWSICMKNGETFKVFGQLSVQQVIAVFGEDTFDVKFLASVNDIWYVIEDSLDKT